MDDLVTLGVLGDLLWIRFLHVGEPCPADVPISPFDQEVPTLRRLATLGRPIFLALDPAVGLGDGRLVGLVVAPSRFHIALLANVAHAALLAVRLIAIFAFLLSCFLSFFLSFSKI